MLIPHFTSGTVSLGWSCRLTSSFRNNPHVNLSISLGWEGEYSVLAPFIVE